MANCRTLLVAAKVTREFGTYWMAIGAVAVEDGRLALPKKKSEGAAGATERVHNRSCLADSLLTTNDPNELQLLRDH
jgi:hypothetical protein